MYPWPNPCRARLPHPPPRPHASTAPALHNLQLANLSAGWLPNPTRELYLVDDLASIVLSLGIALSLVLGALSLYAWRRNRSAQRATQVQLDAARADSNRERWALLGRLDHELKHCLTAMNNAFPGLDPNRLGPAEQKAICTLARNTRRLNQFLTDMRKLAMIEASPIERGEVDMGMVVREAVAMVTTGTAGKTPAGSAHQMTAQVQDQPLPLPTVWGDADLLLRAVYNVVENAVKFSPPATPVEVWALRDGPDAVRIQVADKGPGIPADELPQVGDEFFRGKLARQVPGSGLGLAIVRAVVRKHRGDIGIESELGAGTVVTIRLPAGRQRPDEGGDFRVTTQRSCASNRQDGGTQMNTEDTDSQDFQSVLICVHLCPNLALLLKNSVCQGSWAGNHEGLPTLSPPSLAFGEHQSLAFSRRRAELLRQR